MMWSSCRRSYSSCWISCCIYLSLFYIYVLISLFILFCLLTLTPILNFLSPHSPILPSISPFFLPSSSPIFLIISTLSTSAPTLLLILFSTSPLFLFNPLNYFYFFSIFFISYLLSFSNFLYSFWKHSY